MNHSPAFPSRKNRSNPVAPAAVDPIGAFLVNQKREYSVLNASQRPDAESGERVTDLGEVARVLAGCLAADQYDDDLVVELLMLESMLAEVPVKSKEILEQLGELGDEVRESLVPPGVINVASLRRRTRRLRQQLGALASRVTAALMFFFTGTPALSQDAHAAEDSTKGYAVANAPLVKVIDSLTGQGVGGVQIKTMEERLLGVTDASGQATLGDGYLETDLLSFEKDGYDMYLLDRTQMSSRNIVSMKPLKALQANAAGAKGASAGSGGSRPAAADALGVTRPSAVAKVPEPPRLVPPRPGQAPVLQPPKQPSKPQPPALKLPVRPRTKASDHAPQAHAPAQHGAANAHTAKASVAQAHSPAHGVPSKPQLAASTKAPQAHAAGSSVTREVRLPSRPKTQATHDGSHKFTAAALPSVPHGTPKAAEAHDTHVAPATHKGEAHDGHGGPAGHGAKTTAPKASVKAVAPHVVKAMSAPVLPRRPVSSYAAAHASHKSAGLHVAVPHRMPQARTHAAVAAGTYRVRPGDSLSSIAVQTLGSAKRWQELYAANRDEIANPAFIQVGQVLRLPHAGIHAKGGVYRVKRGDSLYTIANAQLGHGHKWHAIWSLNRDKIRNARLIYPGQVLALPQA